MTDSRLHGLIASCQAAADSPMAHPEVIRAVAKAALRGGATAVRLNGPDDISFVRAVTDAPIIGLFKVTDQSGIRWITPTARHAETIAQAGATVIAVDATDRLRPGGAKPEELIDFVRNQLHLPVMADIDTSEAGLRAAAAGADFIATTLSGYTAGGTPEGPDVELVGELADRVEQPIVAEGRYSTSAEIKMALEAGAAAVVVGTAITDPESLTRRLIRGLS